MIPVLQGDFELEEVLLELAEVKSWKNVVRHLGVPKDILRTIEIDYKEVESQKRGAISWWMDNSVTASWKELADALWKENYPLLAANIKLFEGTLHYYQILHNFAFFC